LRKTKSIRPSSRNPSVAPARFSGSWYVAKRTGDRYPGSPMSRSRNAVARMKKIKTMAIMMCGRARLINSPSERLLLRMDSTSPSIIFINAPVAMYAIQLIIRRSREILK
jgi:hypothetical protein